MRTKLIGFSVALLGLGFGVGCGGDDGHQTIHTDGKTFLDAPIDAPHVCSVDKTIGALTLGSTMTRVSGDWFFTPTMGANMGKKEFVVFAAIDAVETTMSPAGLEDDLLLEVYKGTTFMVNTAYPWTTDGTATTYTAAASIFGDVNMDLSQLENFYFASSGGLTFQAIGEADTNPIDATMSATNFVELDDMGAPIANGCTSSVAGITFHLTQMMAMAATNKMSPEQHAKAQRLLDKKYSILGH